MVRRIAVIAAAAAIAAAGVPAGAGTQVRTRALVAGVTIQTLQNGQVSAYIARIGPQAPVALRWVHAKGAVERTSAMCARVKCLLAVNGDFFRAGGILTTGVPHPEDLTVDDATGPPLDQSVGGRGIYGLPTLNLFPVPDGRHPRTLVGKDKAGGLILAVIDGRQPGYSHGMTLPEAVRFMRRQGAVQIINYDGGGSSTFVVRGKVVNRPSDVLVKKGSRLVAKRFAAKGERVVGRSERPVAEALVLVPISRARLQKPAAASPDVQPKADAKPPTVYQPSAISRPEGSSSMGAVALALVVLNLRLQKLSRRRRRGRRHLSPALAWLVGWHCW